jgi:hypothetical protein
MRRPAGRRRFLPTADFTPYEEAQQPMTTERISGFAKFHARIKFEEHQNKPFWGKPYVKPDQYVATCAYFFQLGGVLGERHSAQVDALGAALLGITGNPGSILKYLSEVATGLQADFPLERMTFPSFVVHETAKKCGYEGGDPSRFFVDRGMQRLPLDASILAARNYTIMGTALGVFQPTTFRSMFALTHRSISKEEWAAAHRAGLNIPSQLDVMSFEEVQDAEDPMFMYYCQECCPELHAILKK